MMWPKWIEVGKGQGRETTKILWIARRSHQFAACNSEAKRLAFRFAPSMGFATFVNSLAFATSSSWNDE